MLETDLGKTDIITKIHMWSALPPKHRIEKFSQCSNNLTSQYARKRCSMLNAVSQKFQDVLLNPVQVFE